MKSMYLDTFQIHDNLLRIGYAVGATIEGLEFSDIRQTSYDNPGESGAYVSANMYGGRLITLEGSVYADTVTAYEVRRRNFIEALALERDVNSVPVARTLKFTTMDDLALQTAVFVKKVRFARQSLTGGRFSVDLFAPDYMLYAQALQSATLVRASGGGAVYPIIYPIIYGASTGGTGVVLNAGTAETFPILYLNGPLTNPLIQNDTLGRFIQLTLTLGAGEQIIIDMKNKTILKGTLSVMSSKTLFSKFWWLAKGNNTIKFLTDSTGDTGSMQMQWQNAYVGV